MTVRETIEQLYIPFLKANGVAQSPIVELAQWDPVPGFEPPLEVKFRTAAGSKLDQDATLIANDINSGDGGLNTKMRAYRDEVLYAVGGGPQRIDWIEFVKPPAPDDQQSTGTFVGERVSPEMVAAFGADASKAYFLLARGAGNIPEGSIYTSPTGAKYRLIRVSLFARWLQAI